MSRALPSALITDKGHRVLLRLEGRFYELNQEELRMALGLPPGPPGLGITVNRDQFQFEFVPDNRTIRLSAKQLRRRVAKLLMAQR